MAISKSKKAEVVNYLSDELKNAGSVTFVAFNAITVAEVSNLRNELRSKGVNYQVVKKTLLGRSLDSSVTGDMPSLDGNIAIAWSTDPSASAQGIQTWIKGAKDRAEKVKIIGGIYESRYMDKASMVEFANIPDMHTLRGMFVNIINTPIQQFATALFKIAEKKA